jgi:hypothetical protein
MSSPGAVLTHNLARRNRNADIKYKHASIDETDVSLVGSVCDTFPIASWIVFETSDRSRHLLALLWSSLVFQMVQ